MTKRETRVVNAFVQCVRSGEFTEEYAIVLIENNRAYGWLSDAAKDAFYEALDALTPEPEVVEEPAAAEPEETEEPAEETVKFSDD